MAEAVSQRHQQFGEAIRELRRAAGYSQEAFAALAGLDRGYMGKAERGENNLSLKVIWQIADALDVPASQLFVNAEKRYSADGRS